MIYVTACTTQHTEKKKYKLNYTKQHWAEMTHTYNLHIFFDWKFFFVKPHRIII